MSLVSLKIIENAIKNNKLSHAYLFYGYADVDVERPVFETIKLLITKSGKEVKVDNIQDLMYYDLKIIEPNQDGIIKKEIVDKTINSLSSTSLEKNSLKFLYIKDVDKGNKHSLNRMLKFIEEPSDNLIIFMSTNKVEKVISTIRSRTQNIFIKRESFEERINRLNIKDIASIKITNILTNIYSNQDQIKQIDLDEFENIYKSLLSIFEKGLENFNVMKLEISKIWTKKNSDIVLNIMQYFFYQLQIDIDKEYPLFLGYENLIQKYKIRKLKLNEIQKEIDLVKKNIKSYSNFNLQKNFLLNTLEEIYGN